MWNCNLALALVAATLGAALVGTGAAARFTIGLVYGGGLLALALAYAAARVREARKPGFRSFSDLGTLPASGGDVDPVASNGLRCCFRCLAAPALVFFALVVAVQLIALLGVPEPAAFPSECLEAATGGVPVGCRRVVVNATDPADEAPLLSGDAAQLFADWADGRFQMWEYSSSSSGDGFEHWVQSSVLWGFPDDVFMSTLEGPGGCTYLQVQSQQRLGKDDGDVNSDRVDSLLSAVSGSLCS